MKITVNISKFRQNLSLYLDRVNWQGVTLFITKRGKPCVVVLPVKKFEELTNAKKQ